MARLQILELPTVRVGDVSETPFVLVIDETSYPTAEAYQTAVAWWGKLSIGIGAKDCIVTDDTIDIPANDVTARLDDAFKAEVHQWAAGTNKTIARLIDAFSHRQKRPRRDDDNDATSEPRLTLDDREVRATVAGDNEQYREQIRQGILYAQGKITRTLDEQRLAQERTDLARDIDRLANHKAALTDALGIDRTRDWDDIRNAAVGLRRKNEDQAAKIDRVRAESARIRATTPTWGFVADIIDAALDDPARPREQRMRPTHPDGTPYSCYEITAEGWGFCDDCRMWSNRPPGHLHQCPETHMQGPIDSKENGDV